ncbi:hypothetical protein ANAPC1_01006 [Anaplasma phagocytophilum]|uniref:Uncharacterized protein n=1 Tax=Anaplasma phagocytophilum TaxID=948 RepID=A0AA45UTW1_ANAPH|nr:hypothetical protein ANAPC1_01006 [Anaplasma phagocytophilum]SBO32868.1 hypothetical protein ANAPC2_01169 [Anaplasma phagocytophilum]SBO32891.1 hypothetical protein ANAPC3_01027 [Anaplasma phagocytophilum]SBO33531.1 hypothetical protein ANAPC4_01191 [Anaplasma phagocytophilum]
MCITYRSLCIPRASVINLIIKNKTRVSVRRLYIVSYACVGLGGNFVGVVDEYSTIRWASTLYAHSKSLGKIGAASLRNRLRSAIFHTERVRTVAL